MNHSQKIIRASVIGIVANVLLVMMTTTTMAQVQLDKQDTGRHTPLSADT